MGKLPNKRCWQIGASRVDNPIEEAYEFNRGWNTDVLIGHRDCRHYVNGTAPCVIHIWSTMTFLFFLLVFFLSLNVIISDVFSLPRFG
ncbi:hypothetical protein Dimus_019666 [Dionaea muscipula]